MGEKEKFKTDRANKPEQLLEYGPKQTAKFIQIKFQNQFLYSQAIC
jgi:hypothetical protein